MYKMDEEKEMRDILRDLREQREWRKKKEQKNKKKNKRRRKEQESDNGAGGINGEDGIYEENKLDSEAVNDEKSMKLLRLLKYTRKEAQKKEKSS